MEKENLILIEIIELNYCQIKESILNKDIRGNNMELVNTQH